MEIVENIFTRMQAIVDDVRSGKIRTQEGFECKACFSCGWREVADPQGSNYRGVVRCTQCRYWEFAGQRIRSGGGNHAI